MEARDRRPVRPTPGDRGSWSHGPIARVQPRAGGAPEPEPEPAQPAPPPPTPQSTSRYATAPARRPQYPPYQPFRQPLPQAARPMMPPTRGGFGLPS